MNELNIQFIDNSDAISMELSVLPVDISIEISFSEGIQGAQGPKGEDGASLTFNDGSSSSIDVGGLDAGTDVGGLNVLDVLDMIINPELFQTEIIGPSSLVNLPGCEHIMEAGSSVDIYIEKSFSRGKIFPVYESDSQFRSGEQTHEILSGTITSNGQYTIMLGENKCELSHDYSAGVQPKGSRGSDNPDYNPLPAGRTQKSIFYINGVMPIYSNSLSISSQSKTLVAVGSDIEINYSVAETESIKHVIKIPYSWGVPSKSYQWDETASRWKPLDSSIFIDNLSFEYIDNNIQYRVYTNSGDKVGARKLKFTI